MARLAAGRRLARHGGGPAPRTTFGVTRDTGSGGSSNSQLFLGHTTAARQNLGRRCASLLVIN
ncbi:hypothetical protein [Goodfellowiella coeruleoviolacea]|uniref:hypothetical protein n=1 Tax=Goodfellowiella coeruleoviolacea TaxID=334858 RepID=UPI0020A48BEF|nr:hypothetical protein [Goodfellowiella coeruleoviolacea]